jgi:hypothetical protein
VLIQTDPFRDLDTLFSRFAGRQTNSAGVMPMDAFRRGKQLARGNRDDDLEL